MTLKTSEGVLMSNSVLDGKKILIVDDEEDVLTQYWKAR